MRWKLQSSARASACASVVFPTPGTPSISRCPWASTETSARRMTSSLPRIMVRNELSSAVARDPMDDWRVVGTINIGFYLNQFAGARYGSTYAVFVVYPKRSEGSLPASMYSPGVRHRKRIGASRVPSVAADLRDKLQ